MPGEDPGGPALRTHALGVPQPKKEQRMCWTEKKAPVRASHQSKTVLLRQYLESKCQGDEYTLESLRVALLYITQTPGIPNRHKQGCAPKHTL